MCFQEFFLILFFILSKIRFELGNLKHNASFENKFLGTTEPGLIREKWLKIQIKIYYFKIRTTYILANSRQA